MYVSDILDELSECRKDGSIEREFGRGRLQQLLGSLRDEDIIESRGWFVSEVNATLAFLQARILLPSGEKCSLRLNARYGRCGYIQFVFGSGRSKGRLGQVAIQIVCRDKRNRKPRSPSRMAEIATQTQPEHAASFFL